jgi:AcrR family transcriptional regulator
MVVTMTSKRSGRSSEESKEQIMKAAVSLFARKGYEGTGVREIATKAGVNLAMINYFFGSKQGLLDEILADFFSRYIQVARHVLDEHPPDLENLENSLRIAIRALAGFFHQEPELMRVALMELPLSSPHTARIKGEWIRHLADMFLDRMEEFFTSRQEITQIMGVVGPAVITALASHYLLKPIVENVGLIKPDEEFYQRYPDILADFCIYGISGFVKRTRKGADPK